MAGIQDTAIAQLNARLAAIPLVMGYLPECWQAGLNIMLEKVLGNFKVKLLCIILLFEVDCNFNTKWLGRAFMWQAEELYFLTEEQYGSRRYKDVIMQCLNKRLWHNYSPHQAQCWIHFYVAKAPVLPLTMMVLLWAGSPLPQPITLAGLLSIPKDDEVLLVPMISTLHSNFLPLKQHATHHA